MEYCWKLNSMSIVVALSFSLYGDLSVTALGSDTKDIGNEDQLSIPLINDKGAPLVAMLDTNAINRKMKVYIRTLMREMIQSSMQEQMKGIFKTSLEKNSTIDFIRNITLQEINEVLKEQGQEGSFGPSGLNGLNGCVYTTISTLLTDKPVDLEYFKGMA